MSYLDENTKPHKANYGSMKSKGVYEAHEMTPQHGYLGEARKNLEKGHIPSGSAKGETEGTSSTLEADTKTRQKTTHFYERSGRGNTHRDSSIDNDPLHNEAGVIPKKGSDEKY